LRVAFLLLHDFRFAAQSMEDFAGSSFHFSKEYARLIGKRGHEVSLYTLGHDMDRPKFYDRGDYVIKAYPVEAYFPPGMRFGNSHSVSLLRELSSEKPDIIHFHSYELWSFPYVSAFAKLFGFGLVAQYHGRVDPLAGVKGRLFSLSYKLADRYLVPFAKEVEGLARNAAVSRGKIIRFPNRGVDVRLFRRVCAPEGHPLLLYVGRTPKPSSSLFEKSPHLLLPMMKVLKSRGEDVRLIMAGDGPGLGHLIEMARALGVSDRVTFMGRVSQEELPELYSRAWFTFDPMHMEDIDPYWGGTLKESLACGTPVIAFNNARPRHSKWGLLVPSDPRASASAVAGALREKVVSSQAYIDGPSFVERCCSWSSVIDRLLGVYGGLVERVGWGSVKREVDNPEAHLGARTS
jgi:glycosyltransferase involved in cell wall biosynthesis